MKIPPKIRRIQKKDRPRLESILKARLLLIETSSRPAYQIPGAFYGKRGYKEQARILDYYAVGDHKLIFSKTSTPISPPRLGPRWKENEEGARHPVRDTL
jgi:hypothetical protein